MSTRRSAAIRKRSEYELVQPTEEAPPQKVNLYYLEYLDEQPIEILHNISVNLPLEDIRNLCSASARMRDICDDQKFWKMKIVRDYPLYVPFNPSSTLDYFRYYYKLHTFLVHANDFGLEPINVEALSQFNTYTNYFVFPGDLTLTDTAPNVEIDPDVTLSNIFDGEQDIIYARMRIRKETLRFASSFNNWGSEFSPAEEEQLFGNKSDRPRVIYRDLASDFKRDQTKLPQLLTYLKEQGFMFLKSLTIPKDNKVIFINNLDILTQEITLDPFAYSVTQGRESSIPKPMLNKWRQEYYANKGKKLTASYLSRQSSPLPDFYDDDDEGDDGAEGQYVAPYDYPPGHYVDEEQEPEGNGNGDYAEGDNGNGDYADEGDYAEDDE